MTYIFGTTLRRYCGADVDAALWRCRGDLPVIIPAVEIDVRRLGAELCARVTHRRWGDKLDVDWGKGDVTAIFRGVQRRHFFTHGNFTLRGRCWDATL